MGGDGSWLEEGVERWGYSGNRRVGGAQGGYQKNIIMICTKYTGCTIILYNLDDLLHISTSRAFGKVITQGKLFQRCTHLLYCSVLSLEGNINIRRTSQPDMGSIFHIQNQWKRKLLCELSKCIYSCLQIPPRENWFQHERRVYAITINFPCITTLALGYSLK